MFLINIHKSWKITLITHTSNELFLLKEITGIQKYFAIRIIPRKSVTTATAVLMNLMQNIDANANSIHSNSPFLFLYPQIVNTSK
jgi:hypothetical protein